MHAPESLDSLGHHALDESQLERREVEVVLRGTDPALLVAGARVEINIKV